MLAQFTQDRLGQPMMDAEGICVPLFRSGSLLSNYHNADLDGMVDEAQRTMDELEDGK